EGAPHLAQARARRERPRTAEQGPGEPPEGEREAEQADGHVDEEGQAPADLRPAQLDEQTSERGTDPDRDADDAAEGAEGLGPLGAPEVLLEHPDPLRVEQARADALEAAGGVEPARVGGEPGRDGGEAE